MRCVHCRGNIVIEFDVSGLGPLAEHAYLQCLLCQQSPDPKDVPPKIQELLRKLNRGGFMRLPTRKERAHAASR